MTEDPRCCGTGTCIINEDGLCWCGQKWNGEEMCFPNADASNNESVQVAVHTEINMSQTTSSVEDLGTIPIPLDP
jgi:hypothetical protein